MDYLTFLLAVLLMHKGLCEEISWDTTVRLSETLALECMHPSIQNLTQLDWVRMNGMEKKNIVIFSSIYGMKINDHYSGRVYLLNSTMKPINPTLFFYNASEADVGFYSCTLNMFPFGVWTKNIQVVQSDNFETAATLNSHMVSEPGKNVTLTYQLQKNWTAQRVTWEKVQPHQIDVLSLCNLSQGRLYTSKYLRQTWSNCSQGSRKSLLIIPQAVSTDSGIYRCRFESSTGENEIFVMSLNVTNGKTNALFMAGGIALLSLVVIIISVVVITCKRRRRRLRREIMACKESRDKENKAANNYRSPTSPNDSTDGAGEDIYVNYPTLPRKQKPRD